MATAMTKLDHYFTPLQAYIVGEGENERGRFDLRIGSRSCRSREANSTGPGCTPRRRGGPTLQGLFLYQFEVLCRNRLGYDKGLSAIAADPAYPPEWQDWILGDPPPGGHGRHRRSDLCAERSTPPGGTTARPVTALFGEQEGRIALANRRKDPLYLFNSLHRQLGYPEPPRTHLPTEDENPIPAMARRLEQLEKRTQLLEEEQRGGIRPDQFYEKPPTPLE